MLEMFCKEYRLTYQPCSEKVGWFLVGFLVRSVVFGPLVKPKQCIYDGVGTVRETDFSVAARNRAIQLFLSKEARMKLHWALWPVPSLLHTLVTRGSRSEALHWQEKLIKSGPTTALLFMFLCVD